MLLLGLLVVAAAIAFAVVVVADNLGGGPHYSVRLFDHHLGTVNTQQAFLAGIALALVLCLGALMLTAGARRGLRRNTELRAARRERRAAGQTGSAADLDPDRDTVAVPVLSKRRSRARQLFGH